MKLGKDEQAFKRLSGISSFSGLAGLHKQWEPTFGLHQPSGC